MAVSLTFDDARVTQLDAGIPILNGFGLKGTFYLSPDIAEPRLIEWKKAAEDGHEMGNHTMSHPCSGGYEFARQNALEDYDLERMATDIDDASEWIHDHFGNSPRYLRLPLRSDLRRSGRFEPELRSSRGGTLLAGTLLQSPTPVYPWQVDLAQTWSHDADRLSPNRPSKSWKTD